MSDDPRTKYVTPATDQTAFNCPHCGVLTTQYWLQPLAVSLKNGGVPLRFTEETAASFLKVVAKDEDRNEDGKRRTRNWVTKLLTRIPFLWAEPSSRWADQTLQNVWLSNCFNCKNLAIWIDDRLCWPAHGEAPPANPDLPEALQADYAEASSILQLSPRGAAALLRLVIQKLCKELGEPDKNLSSAIASLVAKGLDRRVATALDIVRVVGNNAVHPGTMDVADDRTVAENLFKLVNLIVEKMISEPRHLDDMYATLPEGARKQIEERDRKAKEP